MSLEIKAKAGLAFTAAALVATGILGCGVVAIEGKDSKRIPPAVKGYKAYMSDKYYRTLIVESEQPRRSLFRISRLTDVTSFLIIEKAVNDERGISDGFDYLNKRGCEWGSRLLDGNFVEVRLETPSCLAELQY